MPFLQWRRRRVVFWRSREGTASRRLRLALGNARLTHLLRRGVAASNILSWRMIASLTLIYRPSKVGLPPSIPLHMKGRTTLRLLGRVEERGGVTRQLEREGPKPNLRAKRINDGRIDRGSAMNGRTTADSERERGRRGEIKSRHSSPALLAAPLNPTIVAWTAGRAKLELQTCIPSMLIQL